jgi:hypothetical protein
VRIEPEPSARDKIHESQMRRWRGWKTTRSAEDD